MEIWGTFGPSCGNTETIRRMFAAGMTGMRLNLSHCALQERADWVSAMHSAAEREGVRAELLLDLRGRELRSGRRDKPLPLTAGQTVELGEAGMRAPTELIERLLPGMHIFADDGRIELQVQADGRCTVLRGGVLQSGKSISAPECETALPVVAASDAASLASAGEMGVTGVMLPFARTADDVRELRERLLGMGLAGLRIYAKAESAQALAELDGIAAEAECIVVARGDLGGNISPVRVPAAQKHIAHRCAALGKPFIVATQLLTSMETSETPTRAEVSDIFNAVLDGAAGLMLTGETAVGSYPAEAIRWLHDAAAEAEKYLRERFAD
ncbi:MAG: pyruvate kinase [Clostridia bacterium]|nr:pyruvate kinase [Clostridia bacterium]